MTADATRELKQLARLGTMMRSHVFDLDSRRERLAYCVRLLWGSSYVWGDEVIGSTDCSGSVSFALYLLGYDIRVTANEIYHNLCRPISDRPEPGDLAFWFKPNSHEVQHVTVFSDHAMVMDADVGKGFIDTPVSQEIKNRPNQEHEFMRLAWNKVEAWSGGDHAWGVNDKLKGLFGVFAEGDRNE